MARFPLNHRILTYENRDVELSGDSAISLSDTVFGFLDEGFERSPDCIGHDNVCGENMSHVMNQEDDEEEKQNQVNDHQDNSFWEMQHQILEATLCRTTSLESRIRQATKEAVKEAQKEGNVVCACRRPIGNGCRNCLMQVVLRRLENDGFNCAISKSQWRSSPELPPGEHTFLEVLDKSNPKRGEVKIIVELNLRSEFEMARAGQEYNRLVQKLPEVFIGKIERLLTIIKVLCFAAKKCMKEKKIHMGPWRKHSYMQAKWLRVSERFTSSTVPTLSLGYSSRQPRRPRASMLTLDLSESFPNLHCAAVGVM